MLAAFTLRTPFAGFSKAVTASESVLANGEATPSTLVGRVITWIKTSFITPVVEPVAIAPVLMSRVLAARSPIPTQRSFYTDPSTSAPVKVEPSLFNPRAGPYRSPIRTKLNLVLHEHAMARLGEQQWEYNARRRSYNTTSYFATQSIGWPDLDNPAASW